jgi:hypothetical protein
MQTSFDFGSLAEVPLKLRHFLGFFPLALSNTLENSESKLYKLLNYFFSPAKLIPSRTEKEDLTETEQSAKILEAIRKRDMSPCDSLLTQWARDKKGTSGMVAHYHKGIMIALILYIFYCAAVQINAEGTLVDMALYRSITVDIIPVLATWPAMGMWLFTAYFLNKYASVNEISKNTYLILQTISELVILIVPNVAILTTGWVFSSKMFISFQCWVIFMKMHSYNRTNNLLRKEYISRAKDQKPVAEYPKNINLSDFTYYMLSPTLVYWVDKPHKTNNKINWNYLFTQLLLFALCLLSLFIVTSARFYPVAAMRNTVGYVEAWWNMLLPSMAVYIILFLIVFETITNVYAELYSYGHRNFYGDWWNCTNYYEFARKWNTMVHEFLYRHLFLEIVHKLPTTKKLGYLLTIIISAVMHQVVASLILKKFFVFYFVLILTQLPLGYVLNTFVVKLPTRIQNSIWLFTLWTGNALTFSHMVYYNY